MFQSSIHAAAAAAAAAVATAAAAAATAAAAAAIAQPTLETATTLSCGLLFLSFDNRSSNIVLRKNVNKIYLTSTLE